MKVAAIIQARMGSSRLPGKVLMPLVGRPVLWHIVHRLRKCKTVNNIAITTSTNQTDDAIVNFAFDECIDVFQGPVDNVLLRYKIAAEKLGADIIVRVCGDSPLVDPETIDFLVHNLIEKQVDFLIADPNICVIHEGFSPFTFHALQKLHQIAGDDPIAREHITAYFKNHPDFVKTNYISMNSDYHFSGARISIDTPSDMCFLKEVYTRLGVKAGDADIRDVVRLLRSQPELLEINSLVRQKGIDEQDLRILFRCDGDTQLGLGHVYRCITLADELRNKHACGVSFAMARGEVGFDLVRNCNFPIEYKNNYDNEDTWLENVIHQFQPNALIIDVRSDLSRNIMEKWRSNGIMAITIDDPSERRLSSDIAFYPLATRTQNMDWTGMNGELFVGWKWALIRKKLSGVCPMIKGDRPVVLVTMGGSDPAGLTLKAIASLDLLDEDFETVVVLGPAFSGHNELKSLLDGVRKQFTIEENVKDMYVVMARADLAVASFGVTAYELAAMGVPAIYLCMTEDHAESASIFVKNGMAESMGLFTNITEEMIAEKVKQLLHNEEKRLRLGQRACQNVDGHGVDRIAQTIVKKIKKSNG